MEKNLKIAGVSLIEVMISMVLISLLLMAVASVFPRMSSHRKAIQESDIAKDIATEVLDGLQYYFSITPASGSSYSLCNNDNPPGYAEFYNDWYIGKPIGATTYKVKLLNITCNNGTGFNTVDVIVSWTKQGKPHTITVTGTVQ